MKKRIVRDKLMSKTMIKLCCVAAAVLVMCSSGVTAGAVSPWSQTGKAQTADTSEDIHLSRSSVKMQTGEKVSIRLTGAKGTVKWRISDPKVFSYSKGYITAKGEGTATLTAEHKGKKYRCSITVEKKLDGLSADVSEINIKKGEQAVVRINTDGKTVMVMAGNGTLCSMECSPIVENEFDLTVTALKSGSCDLTVFDSKDKNNRFTIHLNVSSGSTGVSVTSGGNSSEAEEMSEEEFTDEVIRLCNEERESRGLPALEKSDSLTASAGVRAGELSTKFSHTRPDGTSCFTAVTERVSACGENIAAGYTTPEDVVTGWMNSPGHKANILSEDFTSIGVGYDPDGCYWVQVFAG